MKSIKLLAAVVVFSSAVPAESLVVRVSPQAPRYAVKASLPVAAGISFQSYAGAFRLAPSLPSALQLGVAPAAPERGIEARPLMTGFALKADDLGKQVSKGDLDGTKESLDAIYNSRGRGNDMYPPGDGSSRNNRDDEFSFPEPTRRLKAALAAAGDKKAKLIIAAADFRNKSQTWTYAVYSPKTERFLNVTADFKGRIRVKKARNLLPFTDSLRQSPALALDEMISLKEAFLTVRGQGFTPVSVTIRPSEKGFVYSFEQEDGAKLDVPAAKQALPAALLAKLTEVIAATGQDLGSFEAREAAKMFGLSSPMIGTESISLGGDAAVHGAWMLETGYALTRRGDGKKVVFLLSEGGALQRTIPSGYEDDFEAEAAFWGWELGFSSDGGAGS